MTKASKKTGAASVLWTEAERQLDEALEESFPASDPPASTPVSAGRPDHPKPKADGPEHGRTAKTK